MEIGAVKQAFNNELILLKKKLAQAKTQIIHKLTRKAKQLTEKKAPDAIQEKFKKKAENAVKEVLILKKIKARDIGKFIVTHKGKLQDFLNKPQVDNDRACARILLHKSMQDKYKSIRNRFSNIPIKDLFMSRNERLKLKKEEKLKKKEKRDRKRDKNKVVNAEGDWDVEEVGDNKKSKVIKNDTIDDEEESGDDQDISNAEDGEANSEQIKSDEQNMSDDNELEEPNSEQSESASDDEKSVHKKILKNYLGKGSKINFKGQSDTDSEGSSNEMEASDDQQSAEEITVVKNIPNKTKKLNIKASISEPALNRKAEIKKPVDKTSKNLKKDSVIEMSENKIKLLENTGKGKPDKKQKDINKNKNLQNKILNKKFKKDSDDSHEVEQKVVDPFFVTATGENYMSVVEPRQPDEIKEEHKQGNRKLRRAVMFGHEPKIKPRQNRQEDNRFNKQNGFNKRPGSNFDQQNNFPPRNNNKFHNKDDNNRFNNKFDGSKKPRFNDRNDRIQEESKPEKLHPSWEAKKKQSGILPFQGKKIVFDES